MATRCSSPGAAGAPGTVATVAPVPSADPRTVRISSTQLFAGASELQIEHRGAVYRLKQTAMGKLILTK